MVVQEVFQVEPLQQFQLICLNKGSMMTMHKLNLGQALMAILGNRVKVDLEALGRRGRENQDPEIEIIEARGAIDQGDKIYV